MTVLLAALAAAAGCTKSSPVQPTATTATTDAGASLTASIVAPRPLLPANNAQVTFLDQPVTLVVRNAVSTQGAVTYTFEVAGDSAFATKIQTKDAVAEGGNGQTSVKLDALTAARDFYWHARASGGGTNGAFGPVYKFTVGPAITLSTPVPIAPLTNATTVQRPALRVTNVTRTGPAGTITYRFEIATSAAFATVAVTGTVPEGVNETGFLPTTDLAYNTLYFWRATAIDVANGVASAPSAAQSFTPFNALWPGQVPTGTHGHAILGPGWGSQILTSFDGHQFQSPPIDESRVFDLLDLGYTPQAALDWMNSHGYPTQALYYPSVSAVGFQYTYVALVNGSWELVLRAGA